MCVGIPTLIIVDGTTGQVITETGRGMINIDPKGEVNHIRYYHYLACI